MSFLYPSFLWALFAIAIPIIIHFFNFRTHKTVYFSNVAFLQDIQQENKSRNKLKNLLILLFRILAIVALVVAFANPVKEKNYLAQDDECKSNYGIYIDNSFSMNAMNQHGRNLDLAKTKAADIVNALKQNSKYFYLTNNLDAKQQHLYIKDIVLEFVSSTDNSPRVRNLSEIFSRFNNLMNDNGNNCKNKLFIISDFQKNCFDSEVFSQDTSFEVVLLPIEPIETSNLYIDSAWFDYPFHLYNSTDSLTIAISNKSNLDYSNQQIQLHINDTLKTISTFNISANTTSEIKLKFTNTVQGFINGKIAIEDYPITYDNELFFNYYIAPKVEILMIYGEKNVFLEKFYDDNRYFSLTQSDASNISIGSFSNYQAIILSSVEKLSTGVLNELKTFVANGGIVAFIPAKNANINDLNEIITYFGFPQFTAFIDLEVKINDINLRDKIYLDAFEAIKENSEMPTAYSHFKIDPNFLTDYTTLLSAENDDKILIYKDIEAGSVYVFSTDLLESNSNFMTNPVSVPTFYNIPIFAKNDNKLYHVIGQEKSAVLKNVDYQENIKLVHTSEDFEFIPVVTKINQNQIKISFDNIDLLAGNYIITNNEKQIGSVSFNYDRNESDLAYYSYEELAQFIKDNNLSWEVTTKTGNFLQNEIISGQKSNYLWKIFVILALIFILTEILTIRLIKN